MNQSKPEYFLAIAESGSISHAAEKLFISQPSLSQYLKRLETSLECELFDRSRTPLQLTDAGRLYYDYLTKSMKAEETLLDDLRNIRNNVSGTLRLGIAFWRCACLLPDVFPQFHEKYPYVRLQLTEGRAAVIASALKSNKIDFAIMNRYVPAEDLDIVYELIARERLLLALPANHPRARQASADPKRINGYPAVSLSVLNELPFFSTKQGQALTLSVNNALAYNHMHPDVLLETENLTTAINLTSAGMGCVFVPEEGAKVCHHSGNVLYCMPDAPGFEWDLNAVYRRDQSLPRIARIFIEEVKQVLNRRN